MDKLPLDIIFNIFSRLPINTLLRLKCVSKQWCNIITDPCLANLHLTRAVEEHRLLVLDYLVKEDGKNSKPKSSRQSTHKLSLVKEDGKNLKASKNPPIAELANLNNYSLEGSCNGLLYFTETNDEGGVVLSNPLTKQNVKLPPATIPTRRPRMKKYGLGFDCSSNTYKIVRVFFREFINWTSYRLGVEVQTLGTSLWREIHEVPPYPLCGRPVSAYGALHWIVDPFLAFDSNLKGMIVSFDIRKEVFNLTPHPDFCSKTCNMFHLVDLRGWLAMVDLSSDSYIEIWVLKDYEKKEWVREFRISITPPIGRSDNGIFKVVGLREHGEILLSYNEDQYYCYNPKTDEIRFIHTLIPDTTTSEVYSHRGSLVSCSRFMAD